MMTLAIEEKPLHQSKIRLVSWHRAREAAARRILGEEWKRMDISVVLISDDKMRTLNAFYRGKRAVTDVLSFAFEKDLVETRPQGEIYIATRQAERQAQRFHVPFEKEVERLLIHGILHLQGHDHMRPAERTVMRGLEKKISAQSRV